jgi:dihydropyrimidinase
MIDVAATDHCPWMYRTQKTRGRQRFDRIPGGIAGIETRGMLLFSEGVAKGRLSLQRFAQVMSTNPARLFGLYPRKGTIAAGSDADLVVVDPRRSTTISRRRLHQNVDYTVFEGWPVSGAPVLTISRGQIVAREGRFVGRVGHGRFVARSAGQTPGMSSLFQRSGRQTASVSSDHDDNV